MKEYTINIATFSKDCPIKAKQLMQETLSEFSILSFGGNDDFSQGGFKVVGTQEDVQEMCNSIILLFEYKVKHLAKDVV